MRSVGTLLLAFVLSMIVAGAVQNRLAVAFGAQEEFILAIILLVVMTVVTTLALAGAMAGSGSVAGIDGTALVLVVLVGLALGALLALQAIVDRSLSFGADDLAIIAEIGMPALLMIAIQWWLVRRRWLKAYAGRRIGSAGITHG